MFAVGSAPSSDSRGLGDFVEEFFGAEVLGGNLSRRARMARIVGVDRANRIDRFIRSIEAEQSFAGGNELLEAGALRDDRTACGEIAHRAIAEPSGARTHVDVLGDGEFTARSA